MLIINRLKRYAQQRFQLCILCVAASTFSGFTLAENNGLSSETSAQCADASLVGELNLVNYLHHHADTTMVVAESEHHLFEFEQLESDTSHYSFGTDVAAHWLRFCLHNPTAQAKELVAAFGPVLAHEFDFYPEDGSPSFQTGNSRLFNTRDINDPAYHFNILVPAFETKTYAIRLTAKNNAFVTAQLWDAESYRIEKDVVEGGYGVFAGIFLGLLLYNIMLYVSIRESVSLWYIAFASSMFSVLAFFDGRFYQYLLPEQPELTYSLLMVCYYLVSLTGAMFSRSYLKLQQYPKLDRGGLILIGAFSIAIAISYFLSIRYFLTLCGLFSMAMIAYYAFFSGTYQLIKGSVEARYYLLALSPLTLSIFEDGFYNLGIITEHIEPYSPKVGLCATMILLAFGLGRTLFEEKRRAQNEALEKSQLANELKNTYNQSLEREIAERTGEIREMNANLEVQAKQLVELDGVKSRFFANISHEFRTPLTLIQGPLSSLLEKEGFKEKEVVQGVYRHSKQLQNLIDQLLSLSKFDGDSAQLRAEKVNIIDISRFFLSQFASYAQERNIELGSSSVETEIEAYIDVEAFQIVVNNLINNALKYTPKGGSILFEIQRIEDEFEDDLNSTGFVQITVTDTGLGISEEDLPNVFNRYYQGESHTDQIGSGVGLSLVKEVINHHGGQIQVNSVVNIGTQFTIRLPLGNEHLHPSEIVKNEHARVPQTLTPFAQVDTVPLETVADSTGISKDVDNNPLETRLTILVVDDNKDMRNYLRSLLDDDYDVIEAIDGMQAEEVFMAKQPALIVTDLMMPKRDGLAFVKIIKQQKEFAQTPIIMLTAKAGQESKIEGLQAEADDYLAKPFDAKELKARIRNLLLKRQSQIVSSEPKIENEFIRRLGDVINSHLADQDFGVEELAKGVFMSAPTLRRKLAACSNWSPSGFLRHYRLDQARQLVLKGNIRSVGELAQAVGFAHAGYFSKLYKKAYGELPL